MKHDYPIIDTDILIIGGGSAGAMAAIRAKEVSPEQKVLVMEKGDIQYSGCIARGMDAMNIVSIPGLTTPQEYVESNSISCEGIMDEPVNYRMAERSYETMQRLVDWDVCFPKYDGEYEVLQVHPKGKFCVTMKEPELKRILADKAKALGAQVMNRTMGLKLLKKGNKITGAVGINVRTGEISVIRAKSVILSSGGTARFGLPDNGHLYGGYDFPGNTGDGYMLAYKAGAELSGFEYTLVYYITKDINAPLLYITLTRGARLFNAFGERCDKAHPSIKSMFADHLQDKGPMRIQLKHLPEEVIKGIEEILFTTERPACERFHAGRDNDFRTGEIELWPTEVFLCGGHGLTGVRIDETGQSCVTGLYAAGDTSLCARGHLSGALVYGEISAESAAEYSKTVELEEVDFAAVQEVVDHLEARKAQSKNPITIEEFEYKVRRIITDYLTPPKNEYKLERVLWWMDRFREELSTMVCIKNNHDLFKCLEVENIITCATLSAIASRERRESRWHPWHYRSDYPERNDEEWTKHIVLTMGKSPEDVIVNHKEIIRMPERGNS